MRFIEPKWLEIKRVNIDLSDGHRQSLRILHLTDLHWSRYVSLEFINQAIKKGLELNPDLIVLTGDYVSGRLGSNFVGSDMYQKYREILRQLPERVPTYACMGNHDGGVWAEYDSAILKRLFQESGIIMLNNESRRIEIKDRHVTLIGLGDLWAKDFDSRKAFAKVDTENRDAKIVLVHNPDAKEELGQYPWDLLLAGHTHGGQFKLPLIGTPFAPVKDRRYVAGLKKWNGRWIYVSKGVGNLKGLRFNARPDITLINLSG